MNIDSQVDIGNRIKAIRQSRGENQTEFAKKIKATLPAVSNWETGRNIPNNKRLKAIADIGGITVEELLYGDKESRKIQIGFRIKNIRQTNGLTLEEFGKLFGASKGNVSLWEKGSSLPSNERIKKIAEYGNMSVEELLYGEKTISNSELELIKKLTKENEQLKDDIKELKIKNNELENKNTELRIELQKEKKNLKNIVETIKSIDLSDR